MRCPRCGGVLSGRLLDGQSIHACETCGGIWFARSALQRYLEQALERTGNPRTPATLDDVEPLSTELACPACSGRRLRSIRPHDVEIDGCSACGGVFLDTGELELLTLESVSAAVEPRTRRARAGVAARGREPVIDALLAALDGALSIFG